MFFGGFFLSLSVVLLYRSVGRVAWNKFEQINELLKHVSSSRQEVVQTIYAECNNASYSRVSVTGCELVFASCILASAYYFINLSYLLSLSLSLSLCFSLFVCVCVCLSVVHGQVSEINALIGRLIDWNRCWITNKTDSKWKKRSEATQTLRAGCSKAEPKIFAPSQIPFPWVRDGQNLTS